jgi:hypothetical protein
MPIKMGDKTFRDFDAAVAFVMRTKGLSKERAQAYVATIERAEKGNKTVKYKKGKKW